MAVNVKVQKEAVGLAFKCAEERLAQGDCVLCLRVLSSWYFNRVAEAAARGCLSEDPRGARLSETLKSKIIAEWLASDISPGGGVGATVLVSLLAGVAVVAMFSLVTRVSQQRGGHARSRRSTTGSHQKAGRVGDR
eukprot:CAMPEP_0177662190 /NCGR_PEP_ID=MMETSP0447-20121125/19136_1 /TAXON_ID=0 /ORGANISM="Stygamoeba regulata, Strain BSH-02190019" /LENGTH=135 /DNA_ID=CAMNT_0019167695 /DNA_START=401 /DNA_END=808 /DNA_ORIENTATION=-